MRNLINFDKWCEQFKPIANHIDDCASVAIPNNQGELIGVLFETFGKALDYVQLFSQVSPKKVWTLVEKENNVLLIENGFHVVNRVGYFITKIECESPETIIELEGAAN